MSTNVMSTGLMVPLTRKVTDEEREEWDEILYDEGSRVRINYEGTLAYLDYDGDNEYGIWFGNPGEFDPKEFYVLHQFGIDVVPHQARPYRCVWYNGTDSDMAMMELQDFLLMTGQQNED